MPRKIERYGWKPSLPDHRRRVADTSGITVLPEVDPRNELPPIFDQGQLGTCTANATAAARPTLPAVPVMTQTFPDNLPGTQSAPRAAAWLFSASAMPT